MTPGSSGQGEDGRPVVGMTTACHAVGTKEEMPIMRKENNYDLKTAWR